MFNIQIAERFVSLEELDQEIEYREKIQKERSNELHPEVLEQLKYEIVLLIKRRVEIETIVEKNYEYYGKGRNH